MTFVFRQPINPDDLRGLASAYDINDEYAISPRLESHQAVTDQLPGVIHHGFTREPERVARYVDQKTGAIAILAIDDTAFKRTAGGMQLRSFSETRYLGDLPQDTSRLEAMTKYSARCGSWKCWLGSVPLSGGKLVVAAPDEIAKSENGDREALLERVGHAFRSLPYWAKPDVGMTPALLESYRRGGGKVSGTRIRDQSGIALYTASSVIGGLEAALSYRTGRTLEGARVTLVGAAGRIGQQLLELFHKSGAHLTLVDRNEQRVRELGVQYGVPVINRNESLEVRADIFCASGPPGQFTEKKVRLVNAAVVGGPANDLLAHPDLYRIRPEVAFIPGATLTAASMYAPHAQKVLGPEDVREHSHSVIETILRLRDVSRGEITTFEAMVAEAELLGRIAKRAWCGKLLSDTPPDDGEV